MNILLRFLTGCGILLISIYSPIFAVVVGVLFIIDEYIKSKNTSGGVLPQLTGDDLLQLARSETSMDQALFNKLVLNYTKKLVEKKYIMIPNSFDYSEASSIVRMYLNRFPDCRKYNAIEVVFESLSKKYPSNYILV